MDTSFVNCISVPEALPTRGLSWRVLDKVGGWGASFPSQKAVNDLQQELPGPRLRAQTGPSHSWRHPARGWEVGSSAWRKRSTSTMAVAKALSPWGRLPGRAQPAPRRSPHLCVCWYSGSMTPGEPACGFLGTRPHSPISGFRSQDPPFWVGRPRLCLSRGACEVGEGVARRESGVRGMGVARGLAQRGATGEVFLLKSNFRFESGIGEDGREVLTSEPLREVAGDFLCSALHSDFRLGLNCDYGSGDFAPQHECFSCLELVRPLVFPSPWYLFSPQWVVSMCPVWRGTTKFLLFFRAWTRERNTICVQISIPKGRKIPLNPKIMNWAGVVNGKILKDAKGGWPLG